MRDNPMAPCEVCDEGFGFVGEEDCEVCGRITCGACGCNTDYRYSYVCHECCEPAWPLEEDE